MLNKLKQDKYLSLPSIKSNDFLIFRRKKKSGPIRWEKTILDSFTNVVDATTVRRMQREVILATGFSDLKELIDMRPDSGSSFIPSSSEPFNEEMEIEYDKFVNWLDHFGLPMFRIHCSGHIMPTMFAKFVAGVATVELPISHKTYQL